MSRIQTKNIFKQIGTDLNPFCASNILPKAPVRFKPSPTTKQLPNEFLVYDVISDVDKGFYSGVRTATDYRVEFTYYVVSDNDIKISELPDTLEDFLIPLGYRPQGNCRSGFDGTTDRAYWQKDYIIRERRNING